MSQLTWAIIPNGSLIAIPHVLDPKSNPNIFSTILTPNRILQVPQ